MGIKNRRAAIAGHTDIFSTRNKLFLSLALAAFFFSDNYSTASETKSGLTVVPDQLTAPGVSLANAGFILPRFALRFIRDNQ